MDPILQHVTSQRSKALEDLKELLRIPSVSTDPARKGDIARSAALVAKHMEAAGLKRRCESVALGGGQDLDPLGRLESNGLHDRAVFARRFEKRGCRGRGLAGRGVEAR